MSTRYIHFHDYKKETLKYPNIFVFLSDWKNFLRIQKLSEFKSATVHGVRVIESFTAYLSL